MVRTVLRRFKRRCRPISLARENANQNEEYLRRDHPSPAKCFSVEVQLRVQLVLADCEQAPLRGPQSKASGSAGGYLLHFLGRAKIFLARKSGRIRTAFLQNTALVMRSFRIRSSAALDIIWLSRAWSSISRTRSRVSPWAASERASRYQYSTASPGLIAS